MAIANTTLQIRKSGTAGVKPTTLSAGELAINYADDKLYYKNSTGDISYFYGANNGPSFSTANANNTLLIASTPNDTLSIVGSGGVSVSACTTTKTVTVGYQGATGPQGSQGVQGATGPQGNQGVQGEVGAQGATGPQGYQGVQGDIGPQGNQGVQGAVGAQGSQGVQGATGPQGNQGVQGAVGAQGSQGVQGAQGSQGVQGATGPQGLTGVQGAQGSQGYQGYQGVQGATGPQGLTGAQGFQGVQGSTGPQGNQGVQGAAAGVNPSNYIAQATLANTQTIPTGTDTVVSFGSADFDPQGWINTGNYRITPNVAGYYEVTSSVDMGSLNYVGQTNLQLRKNGNSITITQQPAANNAGPVTLQATRTIYLNGSTDYITATVWQGSGGNITLTTGNGIWITVTLISYGINGSQGVQGAQGATGPQGLTGAQGSQGSQGATGAQGAIGAQGNQGFQGATGPQGLTGAQGVQGAQGSQGNQGVQGSPGAQGPTGAQGPQGAYYTDAFDRANSAFVTANSAASFANGAFTQANTAITRLGDSAFDGSEVHIGLGAGSGQRTNSGSVAVGGNSGGSSGNYAVALGYGAGGTTQSAGAIAIGKYAGRFYQGNNAIAIGLGAGYGTAAYQPNNTIIINASGTNFDPIDLQYNSFYVNPIRSDNSTSNGMYYNTTTKEVTYGEVLDVWARSQANTANAFANGAFAQANTAIYRLSDSNFYGTEIHIGYGAGSGQRTNSADIAIGGNAGKTGTGDYAIAIGFSAGNQNQHEGAIAIGQSAGRFAQGNNAIAIGYGAGYGTNSSIGQASGTIILSATGSNFSGNTSQPNSFYVNPVRLDNSPANGMYYNTTTKEITYGEVVDIWGRTQANASFTTANNALANTGPLITTNGSAQLFIANTTASTSNTTGALIVSGGLGVSGNISTDSLIVGTSSGSAKFVVNGGTTNTATYISSEARIADGGLHLMKTVSGGVFEAVRAMNFNTTAGTTVRVLGAATSDPFNNTNGGKVFIDAVRTSTNMDLVFSLNDASGVAPTERVRFMGGGNVVLNTYSALYATSFTTSTTTANQIIYSVPTATYRSAKLMLQVTSGTAYQVTELLIVHDGTSVFMTQYGDVSTTGSSLGTFDSTITSGSLNLLFTPVNAVTTVKLSSSLIVV